MAYDYSCADWDGLRDHLRDVPWDDIFKLSASVAASEFCGWVQVGIDVYIPHRKYQVKPHSSPWFSAACAAAIVHRNHFFCLYQQNNQKKPSLPRNLAHRTFHELLIVFSTRVNLLYLLYSTAQRCCLLLLITLHVFTSRTNLKLHNISVTPKMVKKVITNLDSSKASGPDCIPVAVIKNCEPELSYILAELFSICLKESCCPYCWKVSSVVPVFKNVGGRSTARNYHPVSLLSVVSKSLKNL